MSIEQIWYWSYDADGQPPHCKRVSRMPMEFQLSLALGLAKAFVLGCAGYRQTWISKTGEKYWYWPHPLSASGWWIIPARVEARAFALVKAATTQALMEYYGKCDETDAAAVLKRWKRTGAWRKHIWNITPRRELLTPKAITDPLFRAKAKRKESAQMAALERQRQ